MLKFEFNMQALRMFAMLIVIIVILLAFTEISYADSYWVVSDGNGGTIDLTDVGNGFKNIYKILCTVAYPCAAVCFAAGAFKMMFGDEKKMSAGKQQMIYCLIAVAVILLLPTVVKWGCELGVRYGWNPDLEPIDP